MVRPCSQDNLRSPRVRNMLGAPIGSMLEQVAEEHGQTMLPGQPDVTTGQEHARSTNKKHVKIKEQEQIA